MLLCYKDLLRKENHNSPTVIEKDHQFTQKTNCKKKKNYLPKNKGFTISEKISRNSAKESEQISGKFNKADSKLSFKKI